MRRHPTSGAWNAGSSGRARASRLAVLEAQQALVDEWEAEDGPFDEQELWPFLETAVRAQIENTTRILAERQAEAT